MLYAKNLPAWERALRVLAGCAFVAYGAFADHSTLGMVAITVGAMLTLTAVVGFCPACALVGRRSLASDGT